MILTGCLLGKWARQLRFNGQFRFCLRVHGCCVEFHNELQWECFGDAIVSFVGLCEVG